MKSIWEKETQLPHFPVLKGRKKTKVLIIGGGMTGILCAHFLKKNGVDSLVVEGGRIGSGTTGNTTAKITVQHGLIYHKLCSSVGEEKAALYLQANQEALQEYAALCQKIDCDFQTKTSCVYSRENREVLEKEMDVLRKIGCPARLLEETELPFPVVGAVAIPGQAQFHPLRFLAQIAKNLNIYEQSFVKEVREHTAITADGCVDFEQVIFATHFPVDNRHGMYFLKMYQHRSYVLALKGADRIDGMYVDENKKGLSFREYGNVLLLGGGAHRTGKQGGNWEELRRHAKKYYPKAKEIGFWATQDCMSLDSIPYIGKYSARTPDRYVATGYNKWGMTSSMVAAKLLTDQILDRENPYEKIFSPSRNMMKPQLLINGWESVSHLLRPTVPRCPHLGCALQWNEAEHSWDCACHGSRFGEDGRLFNNPANGDLPQKKIPEKRRKE